MGIQPGWLNDGPIQDASFLDPFFMAAESSISTPLQYVGVKESTANSIAGWTVFAGSLFVGKMSSVRGLRAAEGVVNAESATLYRNFGWNELRSIKNSGGKFSIHPEQFQGKQFWVGESGLEMWTSSPRFSKPFTAKITIPKSFVTTGNKNYIFMESDMIIDGFPGGTVLPNNIEKFNSAMKIDWILF